MEIFTFIQMGAKSEDIELEAIGGDGTTVESIIDNFKNFKGEEAQCFMPADRERLPLPLSPPTSISIPIPANTACCLAPHSRATIAKHGSWVTVYGVGEKVGETVGVGVQSSHSTASI